MSRRYIAKVYYNRCMADKGRPWTVKMCGKTFHTSFVEIDGHIEFKFNPKKYPKGWLETKAKAIVKGGLPPDKKKHGYSIDRRHKDQGDGIWLF
jgi:hypothetical protein